MSEELIKRLREEAETIHGLMSFTGVYAALNEAADALSRPAPVQVPDGRYEILAQLAYVMFDGGFTTEEREKWMQQFRELLAAPAAPAVDAEKVMALVKMHAEAGDPNTAQRIHAQIRSLLSATPAASGWQPIETAPKDGTRILVARIGATGGVQHLGIEATPVHVMWACVGYWSAKWNNWNDGFEPCGLAGPNYWQPLPPPPAITNQEARDGH